MDKFFDFLKKISLTLWFRVAFAISVPALLAVGIYYLYHYGNPFFAFSKK